MMRWQRALRWTGRRSLRRAPRATLPPFVALLDARDLAAARAAPRAQAAKRGAWAQLHVPGWRCDDRGRRASALAVPESASARSVDAGVARASSAAGALAVVAAGGVGEGAAVDRHVGLRASTGCKSRRPGARRTTRQIDASPARRRSSARSARSHLRAPARSACLRAGRAPSDRAPMSHRLAPSATSTRPGSTPRSPARPARDRA